MKTGFKFGIALAILISQTSWAANAPGVTDTEILIGAHTNETGKYAQMVTYPDGMAAYFNMVNDAGGVNGRKIKFLRSDCQANNTKCLEVTKELVESKGVFIMGGAQGQAHVAVYKYLAEKGVPDLFNGDGISEYLNPPKKTLFPLYYQWRTEATAVANYIVKAMPKKRVCFLQMVSPLGEEYIGAAVEAFKAANAKTPGVIQIGAIAKVHENAVQADPEVLTLKEDKCDVVFNTAAGTLTAGSINYGFSQGFKPTWIVHTFNINPKFISLLDDGAKDGIISFTQFSKEKSLASSPANWDKYENLMKEKHVVVGGNSVTGYTIAELVTEVLKRAGKDLTREGVVKAAESMKGYTCTMCLVTMSVTAKNHWSFDSGKLVISKSGNWIPL